MVNAIHTGFRSGPRVCQHQTLRLGEGTPSPAAHRTTPPGRFGQPWRRLRPSPATNGPPVHVRSAPARFPACLLARTARTGRTLWPVREDGRQLLRPGASLGDESIMERQVRPDRLDPFRAGCRSTTRASAEAAIHPSEIASHASDQPNGSQSSTPPQIDDGPAPRSVMPRCRGAECHNADSRHSLIPR